MAEKRKKKIAWLVFFGTLLLAYAGIVEPNWIGVHFVDVKDEVLGTDWSGLRIMHLSDLHVDQFGYREQRLLEIVKEQQPDLILVTGDMTQWGKKPMPAQAFLEKLHAPYGVFAILGDSDPKNSKQGCLFCHEPGTNYSKRKVAPYVLDNEMLDVAVSGGRNIRLVGLSISIRGNSYPENNEFLGDGPLLVLSHKSTRWSEGIIKNPHLWLSGDTHGGQIQLPEFLWKALNYKEDTKHMAGLFNNGDHGWLYVTRGIGTTRGFPFRLGVRPEVTVFSFSIPANR